MVVVIGVQKSHPLPACQRYPVVARDGNAGVGLAYQTDPGIGDGSDQRRSIVAGAVVDNQHFEVAATLGQHGIYRGLDVSRLVVKRNDDGKFHECNRALAAIGRVGVKAGPGRVARVCAWPGRASCAAPASAISSSTWVTNSAP